MKLISGPFSLHTLLKHVILPSNSVFQQTNKQRHQHKKLHRQLKDEKKPNGMSYNAAYKRKRFFSSYITRRTQ